jgi:2-beta-glucuronyltransferase
MNMKSDLNEAIDSVTLSDNKPDNFLVLSAHDYRSPRKAGMHFITDELSKRGCTRFFSLRYSLLSRYTSDPRLSLDNKVNRIEKYLDVDCYLWKTWIHPFNTRRKWLRPLENLMYRWYSRGNNSVLRQWIKDANVIFLESGVAPIFFDLIKRVNPQAKIVYRVSDALETINVAEYVNRAFARIASSFNTVVLTSKALTSSVPSRHNLAYVPQGIDYSIADKADPSPYTQGIHAVSLGSMLFDPQFFVLASKRFPEIQFHIIGSGHARHPGYGDNVTLYGEMPFAKTLPYIKHAKLGIAPYSSTDLPIYLRDTSLKLLQYDFFKLPSICPNFIAADYPNRFGYEIGDEHSIANAIESALDPDRPIVSKTVFSWSDVVDRMLAPQLFPDTQL